MENAEKSGQKMVGRESPRRHTRIEGPFDVEFMPHGSQQTFGGQATNLSAGGMLLTSEHSQEAGTRLEIRFHAGDGGFVVEGEVAHSTSSTMGVRFLSTKELVAPFLLPSQVGVEDAASEEKLRAELGFYEVHFRNPQEFLHEYNRNLQSGGVIVQTSHPAAIGTEVDVTVSVEREPPQPVQLRGRVIAQFPSGIGVEITNLQTSGKGLQRLAELACSIRSG